MAFSDSTLSLETDEILARREIEEMTYEDLLVEEVTPPTPEPIIWFHQDELMGLVDEEPLPEDFSEQVVIGSYDDFWINIDDDVDSEEDDSLDWDEDDSIDWDDLLEEAPLHVDDDDAIMEWDQDAAPAG